MNIYWFSSSDNSVHHAILAMNEEHARQLLFETEKDLDPNSFRITGVNEGTDLIISGRHLAVIDGIGIEISK